ncbi:MAG TPA: MarR family transcriptional regulator [Jiangellaceae bacterium]|nr:MarR family transcriptional regulator [Jiangellaceae bacterium]
MTVTPGLPTTRASLSSSLRLSVMRLARRLRAEGADESLTLTQLATLGTLDRHGAMSLGELAAHERVQPPSMTRIVSALEQRRLVVRGPDRDDGRRVVVSITGAARALLAEDRRRRDAWLARSLRELTAAERDVLRRATPVLEKLARL